MPTGSAGTRAEFSLTKERKLESHRLRIGIRVVSRKAGRQALPSCFLNDKQSPCALRESIVNGGARWLALRNFGVHIAITDWDLSATEVQAATADKDRQDFGMNRSLLGDNICRFREFRTAASTAAIVRKTQLRKSSNNSGRILQSGNLSAPQSDFKTI